jgi:hypothetical protein
VEKVHPAARQAFLRPFRLEHENAGVTTLGDNVGNQIGTIVVEAAVDMGEVGGFGVGAVGPGGVGAVSPAGVGALSWERVGAPPQS